MESKVETPAAPGAAWLATLPGRIRAGAEAALAELPADAASAGPALPVAVAAWTEADPAVAARLVEAWLATADAAGEVSPPCPLLAQLAEGVADALPDPDGFLERILPGLARGVEREFDRYDAQGTGLPQWPAAAEAWFPAEYAPGRFTVDLAVLVANEAAAFCRLAQGRADLDRAIGAAEGEQRELDTWLAGNLWDEDAAAFLRRDAAGTEAPERSPCGFIPLAWEGRTEAMVEALRPLAETWRAEDWPLRARILFLALLKRTPHAGAAARLRAMAAPADAAGPERAAWAVLLAAAAAAAGSGGLAAAWLEARRRVLFISAGGAGLLLLLGLLGWWITNRESPGARDAAELERRARQACAEGRHDRAAAWYGQEARRSGSAYFQYRQAVEWLHLEQAAEAEAAFRAILARTPDTPNARMNLALAVLQQGRRAEALELYRGLAAEAERYPELAARARLAAELLERQEALDRE